MADVKYKNSPKMTSPVGVFQFPALSAPSLGSDKFPTPEGVYKVALVLKQALKSTQDFISMLTPYYAEAEADAQALFNALPIGSRKKLKDLTLNPLFEVVYDKDTEQPTGDIIFKFKLTASGVTKKGPKAGQKWTMAPVNYDARGQRIGAGVKIWGGSEGRVGFTASPYFIPGSGQGGLSLRLQGTQIVKLVEGGQASAESLGFGAIEGGYAFDAAAHAMDLPDADTNTVNDQIPF